MVLPRESWPGLAGRSDAARRESPSGAAARRRRGARRGPRGPALRWGLALVVLGSMLAMGTVHVPALLVVAPVALGVGVWALWQAPAGARPPAPALLALGLGAFSALQAVPLPIAVVERLSPEGAATWREALELLGEPARFVPLSLDPGGSLKEALKWSSYAAVFAAAAVVGARRGAVWTSGLVVASATLAALLGLVHDLFGVERLYGLYTIVHAKTGGHVAPLINPNNLAGYCLLGALAGLGLVFSRELRLPRLVVALAAAVSVAGIFLSVSRGGVGALALALFALGLIALVGALRRRGQQAIGSERGMTSSLIAGAGLLAGLLIAAVVFRSVVRRALWDPEESWDKVWMFRKVLPMIADFPWVGVGRGAFDGPFQRYAAAPELMVFPYAENFVVQWLSEWGIPVGLIALGGFAWLLRPSRLGVRFGERGAGRFPELAAMVGVLALLVQNWVDLALEVPAVCYAVACLLGGLWGAAAGRRARRKGASAREGARGPAPRLVALGAALLALGLTASVLAWGRTDPEDDREALARAYVETRGEPERAATARAAVAAHVRAHPADAFPFLVGARLALQAGELGDSLHWLGAALARDPTSGSAHFLAATLVERRGNRSQALLELRTAFEDGAVYHPRVVQRVRRLTRGRGEALISAVAEGPAGVPMLGALTHAVEAPEVKLQLSAEILRRDPSNRPWRLFHATLLLGQLESGVGDCAGADAAGCAARLAEELTELEAQGPVEETLLLLRARLVAASEGPRAAEALLAASCERVGMTPACLWARFRAANQVGPGEANAAADALVGRLCADGADACAAVSEQVADTIGGEALAWRRLALRLRAAKEAPTTGRWLRVASSALAQHDLGLALQSLDKAERTQQDLDAADRAELERLRAAVAAELPRGSAPSVAE